MEQIKGAAVPHEDKDSDVRATVERMLADIRFAHDQVRRFPESQRGGLRKCFTDHGWDVDVYDQKRYD